MSAIVPDRAEQPEQHWHASPALLVAYAGGRASAADAWSAEAHLTDCPLCRAELAALVVRHDADRDLLASTRSALLDGAVRAPQLDAAPRPSRAPRGPRPLRSTGPSWHLRWVVRPTSLGAVALAVFAAVAVTGATQFLPGAGGGGWLLWLIAPAVPLAGVALCSFGDDAFGREAELATPSAGWRLVLWRTLAVLLTALPLALAAGWAVAALPGLSSGVATTAPRAWLPALWLLPALALTAVTLALGTWVALPRAAAAVAASWALVVLASSPSGHPRSWTDAQLITHVADGPVEPWSLHLLSGWAQPGWALLLVAALAVVVARREAFGRAPAVTWGRTRGAGA